MQVGKDEASEESRMEPLADQTKTSICPGVSIRMWLGSGVGEVAAADGACDGGRHLFSSKPIT